MPLHWVKPANSAVLAAQFQLLILWFQPFSLLVQLYSCLSRTRMFPATIYLSGLWPIVFTFQTACLALNALALAQSL